MKHGIAFRKFSRTSSHRMLMLRNLVTSLFEHEQIKTTLPKARDTARLAEKMITLAKKGDQAAWNSAHGFLLNRALLPKLFGSYASRYSVRPGGYTRIHKFGNRKGDNAPHAILELVDNPHDLKYEMTCRAIGREVLQDKMKLDRPVALINKGIEGVPELVEKEKHIKFGAPNGLLRPKTRWNLQKVLKYRKPESVQEISEKAGEYADSLLASPLAFKKIHDTNAKENQVPYAARISRVGQALPGQKTGALDMSRGWLGLKRRSRDGPTLTLKSMGKGGPETVPS